VALLASCSSGGSGGSSATGPAPSGGTTVAGGNADCSHGLTGTEPGVIRVTCNGPAEIKIQAGAVSRDLHGGRCQQAAGAWSAAVGVVIDEAGVSGKYTGPAVEVITINNTDKPGKGTIQAVLGGKHYSVLGTATLNLSADQQTAHAEGTSEQLSDVPGAKIVVDVACNGSP
jgi:hypothetical protein